MQRPVILQRRLWGDSEGSSLTLLLGTPEPAETTPIYGVKGLVDDGSLDECLDLRGSCY